MRRPAFVYALLGSASIVSAVEYAPGQDTWCMTYLSTYLVPISNQANAPALARPTKEPGRQPIAPSLKPGSVTQSLDPITEPVIDEVVTSSLSTELGSTVSTDAIPTSSGFIEPAGRSVIFRVSVLDNQKRSTNKRQAIGGFVGDDNPQSCTFAATFNLADGQLFEDGAPIYYSGESYKELSGLDFPSSGSITNTFEDTGRLTFRNSGLPNRRAGFCQTPDGIVYMTFTNGPVGCISVELVVYDVTQCQDGRLIGDDDETATPFETIPQDTATARETDPTVTSGIEDVITMQISYSSTDFITQSELMESSHTSDLGVSDIVSLETTVTETATPDTIITDTTVTDTAIMDTTPLTTSTIGVDVTTGVTTDTTTLAASTTTAEASATTSDALSPSCSNIDNPYTASNGVTFTLSCNTLITSILLKDPYVSEFIPCLQACSEDEACVGMYFFKGGTSFDSYCYLLSYIYDDPAVEDYRFDVAFKDPVTADTTAAATDTETGDITTADTTTTNTEIVDTTTTDTTTAVIPAGDTTTSAAPTETSGLSTCDDLSNPLEVGDGTYDISCNGFRLLTDSLTLMTNTFLDCIQACSHNNNCIAVEYVVASRICYLAFAFETEEFIMEDGYYFAIRQRA
ncbi:uncharacterized protein B0J16DRAFT_145655 [Fusarium flagelliforme]|uniref:uncharacterized protein n=1 Tax=Fusarium flagelliforme TaxID=2675880 RepID=UPI001E8DC63B|nr:uncharacterized protein B0J16DRAFT_145655 [Fusarium flagelliforme]KAH7186004.1 hypothetical protein B0J16DRAFT_145655 [Fusarium flagelliforme]